MRVIENPKSISLYDAAGAVIVIKHATEGHDITEWKLVTMLKQFYYPRMEKTHDNNRAVYNINKALESAKALVEDRDWEILCEEIKKPVTEKDIHPGVMSQFYPWMKLILEAPEAKVT